MSAAKRTFQRQPHSFISLFSSFAPFISHRSPLPTHFFCHLVPSSSLRHPFQTPPLVISISKLLPFVILSVPCPDFPTHPASLTHPHSPASLSLPLAGPAAGPGSPCPARWTRRRRRRQAVCRLRGRGEEVEDELRRLAEGRAAPARPQLAQIHLGVRARSERECVCA